jgi:hypothetical protein
MTSARRTSYSRWPIFLPEREKDDPPTVSAVGTAEEREPIAPCSTPPLRKASATEGLRGWLCSRSPTDHNCHLGDDRQVLLIADRGRS